MNEQKNPDSALLLVPREEIERFAREHPDARMVLSTSGDEVVTVPLEPHAEKLQPQSVEEWIERVNRAEEQLDASDDDLRRLPSGWWILPGLLGGAVLFAWIGSRLIAAAIE